MGDAAVQKMMEMKKACANVMLHSAQEAAARIVMSERKAFRFQEEAEFAKQEALGMIRRLKQTMDSKMHEAEVLSFRQKKKIKELEGELQEANRIVRELREELAIVSDELERTRKAEQSNLLNNQQSNSDAHASKHAETSHNTKPDASENILDSCSNSELGPNLTFDVKSSTLATGKFESQSKKTRDAALMTPGDIPYLPSILKRTKVPPIYSNKFCQGIHALIANKSVGSFCSPYEIAGSEKNLVADSMMADSPFVRKYSSSGVKKIQSALTTSGVGSKQNVPEKPAHDEDGGHVEYANINAPLYEHLPTRDLIRHSLVHCPSKSAAKGSSPAEENLKFSKREAQKAIEISRLTETTNFETLPGYVQAKENKNILIKPCSSKNTARNGKKEANIPTREAAEVVQPLATEVGTMDLDFGIVPGNPNTGSVDVKYTKGSFMFTTNVIQYSRKRSRQAKENTNSNCDGEAPPDPGCRKRKMSEGRFDPLPDINNQVPGLQSSKNQDCESIAQVAQQLLALSDSKWCC